MPSTPQENRPTFEIGEKVYGLDKVGMWWEGRILEVGRDPHPEHSRVVPTYHLHYIHWNARHDEWLLEECVLKFTEANRKIVERLNTERRRERAKEDAEEVEELGVEVDEVSIKEEDEDDVEDQDSRSLGFEEQVTLVIANLREQMMAFRDPTLKAEAYKVMDMDPEADPGPCLAMAVWDNLGRYPRLPKPQNFMPGL